MSQTEPNASSSRDRAIPDASSLPAEWEAELARRGINAHELYDLVNELYDQEVGNICPPRSDVFRALTLTKLESVKVVILGQDPYDTPGLAHGLAFSAPTVRPGPRAAPSLARVFRNLERDPDVDFDRPKDGDLTRWAANGVLLLNAALTVSARVPGSHQGYWDSFTEGVLQAVGETAPHAAFLLWGEPANERYDAAEVNVSPEAAIRASHPVASRSNGYPLFSQSRPFSDANEFLASRGVAAVDWRL